MTDSMYNVRLHPPDISTVILTTNCKSLVSLLIFVCALFLSRLLIMLSVIFIECLFTIIATAKKMTSLFAACLYYLFNM